MQKKREADPVEVALAVLPAWQLAVFRFNDTVARRLGIVPSDLQCLFVLDRRDGSTPGEIGRLVHLTSGATSRMIDRLLRAGLVTREHDTVDRRRVNITITPQAHEALHDLYDPLDDALRTMLRDLSPDALRAIVDLAQQAEARTTELELGLRPLDRPVTS